jgi:hypothetical protein
MIDVNPLGWAWELTKFFDLEDVVQKAIWDL